MVELDVSLYRDDFSSKKDYLSVVADHLTMNLDGKHVVLLMMFYRLREQHVSLNAILI